MASPILQTVSAITLDEGNSVVIAAPTGIQNNDILFAIVNTVTTTAVITPPAGFTYYSETNHAGYYNARFYWKRASSESGSYTFSLNISTVFLGTIFRISGCNTTGVPISISSSAVGVSNSAIASSITTTSADNLLLGITTLDDLYTCTSPAGTTEVLDESYVHAYYKALPTAGSTGNLTTSISGSTPWSANLFSFTPQISVSLSPNKISNATTLAIPTLQIPALGFITVTWTPSDDLSVTGYYVKYGTSTGVYTQEIDVSGRTTSSSVISNLAAGYTYYIVITSHGAGGHDSYESEPTTEISAIATSSTSLTVTKISSTSNFTIPTLTLGIISLTTTKISSTTNISNTVLVVGGGSGVTPNKLTNLTTLAAITLALTGDLSVSKLANTTKLAAITLTTEPPSVAVLGTVPIILAEISVNVSGSETTRYLSNIGFISESTDTPANTNYLPLLIGNIETTETISITGTPSFSFTDLEIINADGALDSWLLDIWTNRSIKLYLGFRGQARSSFTLIFDGIIADIGTKSRTSLNLKVRDKLQRLNAPLSETTLGGSSVNKEAIIPYLFGEVFNITPLLTNDPTHEYQVCGAAIEDIIEVRDNGVPVSVTEFLSTGKFNLLARPAGAITASVQGYKPTTYVNDIANTIQRIVLNFGKAVDRFQLSDIDTGNFTAFSTNFPQSIGYYVNSKENIITIIQFLASSIGAQVLCNRLGKLQLFQVKVSGTSTFTITPAMVVFGSLSIVSRPEVQSTIILNYCKNNVTQDNLETGVVPVSKELFQEGWSSITQTDSVVATNYKHSALPTAIDTALINTTEATAEALRRLNLWKTQRTVFQLIGTSELAGITIGQMVTLQHTRFNLSAGVLGMVISVKMDWTTNRPTLQILV